MIRTSLCALAPGLTPGACNNADDAAAEAAQAAGEAQEAANSAAVTGGAIAADTGQAAADAAAFDTLGDVAAQEANEAAREGTQPEQAPMQ